MAIPDNYIDKITKDGESRMISPAADKVRVDSEHYEGDNLDDVLDEIAEAIDEAGSGDGTVKGVKVGSTTYDPDSETGVVDLSTPIANKVDKVPGKGLSANDYTDAEKTKLQNLPTADGLTQQLSSKANASEVYSKSEVNTMVGNKQDALTFDDEPTAGHTTQVMSSDKIKTAIDQVTPTIDANGKWVIGGVATDKEAQGPRGNSILVNEGSTAIQALIVNNVSDGGETDILSAEMGKVLRQNIMRIFNALGTYAFPEGKPTLNWGSTVINHSINVNGVTGGLTIADVEIDGVSASSLPAQIVEGKSLSLRLVLPSDLYVFNDGVSITMGGVNITTQQGVWDESTGEINIAEVIGDIVISANAITYVGYGETNGNLVAMWDGKNVDAANNQWVDVIGQRVLPLSNCDVQSDHVVFDGTNSEAINTDASVYVDAEPTAGTVESVLSHAVLTSGSFCFVFAQPMASKRICVLNIKQSDSVVGYAFTQAFGSSEPSNPKAWYSAAAPTIKCLSLSNTLGVINGTNMTRDIGPLNGMATSYSRLSMFSLISSQGAIIRSQGSMYCLRIYNVQLTADQVAQNYKVDQKRFNLQ